MAQRQVKHIPGNLTYFNATNTDDVLVATKHCEVYLPDNANNLMLTVKNAITKSRSTYNPTMEKVIVRTNNATIEGNSTLWVNNGSSVDLLYDDGEWRLV